MQTQMTPYFIVFGSGDIWPFIILAHDKIGFKLGSIVAPKARIVFVGRHLIIGPSDNWS